jgi:hypothetical protein
MLSPRWSLSSPAWTGGGAVAADGSYLHQSVLFVAQSANHLPAALPVAGPGQDAFIRRGMCERVGYKLGDNPTLSVPMWPV